jgi:type II secretory pathway pseudopilin PulG
MKHHPKSHEQGISRQKTKGFTLLELGLVLGIIAVLVAILLPKGFDALRHARIQQVAKTVETAKTAIVNYLSLSGGNGNLPRTEGYNIPVIGAALSGATYETLGPAARLDTVLLSTGMLEKPISIRMDSQARVSTGEGNELIWDQEEHAFRMDPDAVPRRDWSRVTRLETRTVMSTRPSTGKGANFRLNGTQELPLNAIVAYMVVPDCPAKDAFELATLMNGSQLAPVEGLFSDMGIVAYDTPVNGVTDVYIYLTTL